MTKKFFTILLCFSMLLSAQLSAAFTLNSAIENPAATTVVEPTDGLKGFNPKTLLSLSPKELRKLTGKKLNFAQKIVWKAMQKKMKKAGSDASISKGLYIVLAIVGLGWLAMGLNDDFKGSDWLISLLLYFLFWLPGLIYTLIKMKKYYN